MAITHIQFSSLENLYYYYNLVIFDSCLPDCLVNLSRRANSHGFFAPERWKGNNTESVVHEISLNPDTMSRPDKAWHSTLVHEMVHMWQQTHGTPPRRCYHDKEWADKMEEIGLMPTSTGQPGGKRTGQRVTHYVIEGGPFDQAFEKITDEQLASLKLPYIPNVPPVLPVDIPGIEGTGGGGSSISVKVSRSGVKSVYTCDCAKVWGRPGLNIQCSSCNKTMLEH